MTIRFFCVAVMFLAVSPTIPVKAQESTTVGGYGELHYNDPDGTSPGILDLHRFVIYLGHGFTEAISFKSELEIEHTRIEATDRGGAKGGEVSIEQAYLDWHFNKSIGMKAGVIIVPVGIINQIHEPPTFNGVERPNVDDVIIPSTWSEAGAGIYGSFAEGFNYQLYVVAGLKAEGFDSFMGIREGRQEGFESSIANPSVTGRLDYAPVPGLKVGGSFFVGNTSDGIAEIGSGTLSVLSGDLQYTTGQLSIRAEGALDNLGDADRINDYFVKFLPVASRMDGMYVEGAYNVLPFLVAETDQTLNLFTRYESYNTGEGVTSLYLDELVLYLNRNDVTVGATYKPTYNIAFKIDYQFLNNAAGTNRKQLNLGIGYSF